MAKGESSTESLKITAHSPLCSLYCSVFIMKWFIHLHLHHPNSSLHIQSSAQQPKNHVYLLEKSFIYPVIASPSTITIKYTAVRKRKPLFQIVGLILFGTFTFSLPFVLLFSLDPWFCWSFSFYMCKTTYYKRSLVDGMEEGIVYDILLSMDTDMGGNHSLGYILALWLIWGEKI